MKRLLSIRVAVGTALVAGALAGAPAPALAACETVWVEAYDVALEVERDVYRVGETARVTATVTRTDTGAPVAGAEAFAWLFFEDSMIVDYDETDAAGTAVVELELKKKHVETGPVTLRSMAYYSLADTPCAGLVEYGKKKVRDAFTIER